MADILIRGMEMPKTCSDCPCFVWDVNAVSSSPILAAQNDGTMVCAFTREEIWNTKRGDLCPLVPLPEGHGELIDKQAFIADIDGFIECMTSVGAVVDGELLWGKLLDALANAKTIVPAEGGTEDDGNA